MGLVNSMIDGYTVLLRLHYTLRGEITLILLAILENMSALPTQHNLSCIEFSELNITAAVVAALLCISFYCITTVLVSFHIQDKGGINYG